jgi:hypothetical protein
MHTQFRGFDNSCRLVSKSGLQLPQKAVYTYCTVLEDCTDTQSLAAPAL